MTIDAILIFVTLASAIVGILGSPSKWEQMGLIALAVSSSSATLLKAYKDNRAKELVAGGLAALIAKSSPTKSFINALGYGFAGAARRHHLTLSDSTVEVGEGHMFFFKGPTGSPQGALLIHSDEYGPLWADYVYHKPLDRTAESMMYNVSDVETEQDLSEALQRFAAIGRFAISREVSWAQGPTAQLTRSMNYEPRSAGAAVRLGALSASVSIDQDFINKILNIPAVERDWFAYQEFQRQLTTQAAPAHQAPSARGINKP